jgi:UDP-N-acetylglucosamine 2-epimerase (non-hydrolysing)
MRLAYVVGTRPNLVKMAPVLAALRRRLPDAEHLLVHTGQHYDRELSGVFFEDLGVPAPDHMLRVGSGSHSDQVARTMQRLRPVLEQGPCDLVIVSGDVNSTVAAAIVAAHVGVRLAHVESGLRSFDRTMPEELNRVLTDRLSNLLFAHSGDAVENLAREGIAGECVSFAGNTMIDTLVAMEPRFRAAGTATRLGLTAGEFLLVTLHRPALVDGPLLRDVMNELERMSEHLPVVFPVHPRTCRNLTGVDVGSRVQLLAPLGYVDFLSLEADAAAVLTDSGGIQEETTFLGVPCFTLRANTERPVTVDRGTNTLLGLEPARIAEIVPALERGAGVGTEPPPLWDGHAAQRVADVISRSIESACRLRSGAL